MSAWPGETDTRALREFLAAVAAAGIGAYIRAKRSPAPLSLASLAVGAAEAVVCGFFAIGIAAFMEWQDARTTTGIAAGLGLLGTSFVSDMLVKVLGRKADNA